jgi:hypothetical protein
MLRFHCPENVDGTPPARVMSFVWDCMRKLMSKQLLGTICWPDMLRTFFSHVRKHDRTFDVGRWSSAPVPWWNKRKKNLPQVCLFRSPFVLLSFLLRW